MSSFVKETVLRISGVDTYKCMNCGKCAAACPAGEEMEFSPQQFVLMVQSGRTEELLLSDAAFKCQSCLTCIQRCPRGVAPGKLVEAVRLTIIREKDKNRLTPDAVIPCLTEDMPQQAVVTAFRKYRR